MVIVNVITAISTLVRITSVFWIKAKGGYYIAGNKETCKNNNSIKGELQRQNKLISSERPFKILQNETKMIKIGQAVLEIFNFKDLELDNFTRKNDRKSENIKIAAVTLQKLW